MGKLMEDSENGAWNPSLQAIGSYFHSLGRHSDAIGCFERALHSSSQNEEERLNTLYFLGISYYQMGRFPEALKVFGEVYLSGKELESSQRISYLSYAYMIIILRWIVRVTGDSSSIQQGLRLIEEGLNSLEETGRDHWKAPLLLEKGIFSHYCGDSVLARDFSEESYQIAKSNKEYSWPLGYHGSMVSRFSRYQNDLERCLAVLEEVDTRSNSTHTQIQVYTEQLRVLLSKERSISEMIDLARILDSLIQNNTAPRTILEARLAMATAYIFSGSYEEGLSNLAKAEELVLPSQEFHRPCLIMEMADCFKDLDNSKLPDAATIHEISQLSRSIEEERRKIDVYWGN